MLRGFIAERSKTTLAMPNRFRWVYFLPLLHFGACLISMVGGLIIPQLQHLGIIWVFVMLIDLPISLVAYILGWKFQLLAVIWIFAAGTAWWYFLSLVLEHALQRLRHRYSHRNRGSVTRLDI